MYFARYISVILASTIKFIGGPLTGATLGLSWLETSVCTVMGMMFTVIVVTYAGTALRTFLDRYRKRPQTRFTSRTRLAIRVWKRFGLMGIALLTPLILTPIGGTALAVSFRAGRSKLLLYMLISGICWAIIQTLAIYQIPGLKGLITK